MSGQKDMSGQQALNNKRKYDSNKQRGFFVDLLGLKVLWPHLKPWKTSVLAAIGLIPLIALVQGYRPFLMKRAIDEGILQNNSSTLFKICMIYALVVISEYVFRASQKLFSAKAVYKMIASIRQTMVRHILRLPMKYHDKNLSGVMVTRATSDLNNLSQSLNEGILTSVIDLAVVVISMGGIFYLDWRLGMIVLISLPIVVWVIMFFSAILKKTMLQGRRLIARVNGFNQECLTAHSTIKLLQSEKDATERNYTMSKEYRNVQMRGSVADAFLFAILDGIASIFLGFVLWHALSRYFDPSKAGITIGTLIAVTQYMQQTYEPLKHLGNKISMLQGAFTAIERVFSVLEVTPQNNSSDNSVKLEESNTGNLEFKDVSFSYDDKKQILNRINFQAKSGQSLAIVGPTGGGKSTIVKLLTRLYDTYKGEIVVNQKDIQQISLKELRKKIVVVPQDITLYEGSILFNITLNDQSITRAKIEEAAKMVGAHHFITQLPKGYETPIKERGNNLSVGQKQLIVFARALARDPMFLILDEATSSIDPASENLIQSALEQILKTCTTLVVAHRKSTIEKCDRVIVINQGELIEDGSPDELKAADTFYSRLIRS